MNKLSNIIVTLNCENCTLTVDTQDFTTNGIIYRNAYSPNKYSCSITGDIGSYYFSLSDAESPKYIEQLQSEPCFKSCEFDFPLHKYYNYSNDDKTQVIFFIPNDDQVKIYYNFTNMSEFEGELIDKFDLTQNEGNKEKIPNNKLIFDLNVKDIKENEKYLIIQLISEDEKDFNFVMNKFIHSPNTDFNYHINLVSMDKSETIKNDILSLDSDSLYKIDLHLLCGNGMISLDESGNHDYYLNHQILESITLFIKLPNPAISSINFDKEENFTYFINATKMIDSEKIEKLELQKTHRIKYFLDEPNGIFPIRLKISIDKNKKKTLYINYRFIELEKNETRDEVYNTTDERFIIDISNNELCDLKILEDKYFTEFRRGIISISVPEECYLTHMNLAINKNETNEFLYKKVFLEITPLYISKDEENAQQEIHLPKNTYIQIDLNQTTNLVFSELNQDYNFIIIDIANSTDIHISNIDQFKNCANNFGKLTCYLSRNASKYGMSIEPNFGTIFVRYTTKRVIFTHFELWSDFIDKIEIDQETNYFRLIHENIKIRKGGREFNMSSFKIAYYYRVYDYLDFYEDRDINNILNKLNAKYSFRKELKQEQIDSDGNITTEIKFGRDLEKKQFYINIIGEVTYNGSVEYFSYASTTFRLSQIDPTSFEEKWIYTLVGIIVIFVATIIYIIIKLIQNRKNKKAKINGNLSEVQKLVNKSDNNK